MAALDSNAIQIGAGSLFVAPIGTTEPTTATATLPSAWRQVGYTEEGSTFSYNVSTEGIFVAEALDPLRIDSTKREGKVSFSMAEMTRSNLALALNAGAAAVQDGSSLEPPALGAEVRVMIALNTQGGARWLFRRCFQGGEIAVDRKKSPDKALLPVEFQLELPTGAQPFIVFPTSAGYV